MRYFLGISLLTSVLLISRLCLKSRISKKLQYSLWLLIPIYMLMAPIVSIPVTIAPHISSEVNTQMITEPQAEHTVADVSPYFGEISNYSSDPNVNLLVSPEEIYKENNADINSIPESESAKESLSFSELIASINIKVLIKAANTISVVFVLVLFVYNLGFALYCKNKRSFIERDTNTGLKLFKLNFKGTPFLLGKDIYLNDLALMESNREYAVCHEFCHYKHGDQFWSVVRYLVLAVNWYNPLIWAAFIASEQDSEYACDEEVMKLIGDSRRIEYGKVLLSFLSESSSLKRDLSISTAMNGRSKRYMKERITNIKKSRSISVIAIVLSLTVALLAVGCSLIDVKETTVETSETPQTISWEATDKTVWANVHGLPLRSQPDSNASVVATLKDGTPLNVIEESTDWYHVQTSNGIDGYTRIIFTTDHEPDPPTATPTPFINTGNYDAVVITDYGQLGVPQIGLLPDGVYTCTMSSVDYPYMGQDTCMFALWHQECISDEALNELQIGDNFTGNSSIFIDNALVTCLIPNEVSPYFLYGTHYTGEILTVTEDGPNGGIYYFAKAQSGVWYLFSDNDNPVIDIDYNSIFNEDYIRLPLAENAHIYDGYTPFLFDNLPENITDEERRAIGDFTDTSHDFSNPESIAEFFTRVMDGTCSYSYSSTNFNSAIHRRTVIEVVDNEVVSVWFWFQV